MDQRYHTFSLGHYDQVPGASCSIYLRGRDSYSKVGGGIGGLVRGEARQRAIARCDLEGSGGMHPWDFLGVFWVSEIDSDAISGI